ncbi:hypothetical protein AB0B45_02495 [Nonomuraea sp. NPDC049152]|uniref:hypothetical protein n=1 Tax=Nonomuraea sp. NPDC049152 TaxID=3154350 RepID=UPI0033F6CFCB
MPSLPSDNEPHGIIRGIVAHGGTTTIYNAIRDVAPASEISDEQVEKIAQALAAKAEAAALAERPRQRRREWMLLIVGLIGGALLSIPIGIWINSIS